MVLVRFEYLHSDSERKLLIGQFNLTHVKISGTRKPRHVHKLSSVADGSQRIVYLLKNEAKSFRDGSQDICNDLESNLGPFAGFKAEIIQKQALFQFLC